MFDLPQCGGAEAVRVRAKLVRLPTTAGWKARLIHAIDRAGVHSSVATERLKIFTTRDPLTCTPIGLNETVLWVMVNCPTLRRIAWNVN